MLALMLVVAGGLPEPVAAPTRTVSVMPSVTVTLPSPTVTWLSPGARPQEVRWRSVGPVGDTVRITLERHGCSGEIAVLAGPTANDGVEAVTVPTLATGGTFAVRVRSTSTSAFGCSSDFPVVIGPFSCSDPVAGMAWQAGRRQRVAWISSDPVGARIDIGLARPGETGRFRALAQGVANDGEEFVNVPADVPPGAYKLVFDLTGPRAAATYFSPIFSITPGR
ncbi:MAG TPA: hypothetical protein VMT19_12145 [Thermoanaerobaculaceae bacterium]|nr:hypothetical protein [Thermoanaerobaculaceae bacterium]